MCLEDTGQSVFKVSRSCGICMNNNNNNTVFLRTIDYTKILAQVLDAHETSFALESPFFFEATKQASICRDIAMPPEFYTSSLSHLHQLLVYRVVLSAPS